MEPSHLVPEGDQPRDAGLKISPAVLKRRSQAAEAGKAVLSFKDNLQTDGKDLRMSLSSALQGKVVI